MRKKSAGILLYKYEDNQLKVLLVHPGGPYLANKNDYCWSIPKGEFEDTETTFETALREVKEELGVELPKDEDKYIYLGVAKQNNKDVFCYAINKDFDVNTLVSNYCEVEYPQKSGIFITIPEVDKAQWFTIDEVQQYIVKKQYKLIKKLIFFLNSIENT